MAKKKNEESFTPQQLQMEIDLVCTKGEKVVVQPMTLAEALAITKKEGWHYQHYQKGYHSYKTNI